MQSQNFRLLAQFCYNLKILIKPVPNDGIRNKQYHNHILDILIENIASTNAIIVAIQYSDHMTYNTNKHATPAIRQMSANVIILSFIMWMKRYRVHAGIPIVINFDPIFYFIQHQYYIEASKN